ncbi:MAG TPA: formate dehydrogenase accessory sulfurtransferase FdhD [Anaerolineales bacterium]|nr:formate dehydrogenase accessory sulfurtransferase FdhD [Anaerolineales bacterium]
MTDLFISQEIIDFNYPSQKKSVSNVIMEAPVDISVNSKYWLTLMCSPTSLEELATGFLFNEGVINSQDEIKLIDICDDKTSIDIWLNHSVEFPEKWQRTSGCTGGSTSVTSIDLPKLDPPEIQVSSSTITSLINQLLENQDLYMISGGVHSSALSNGENLLVVMEDIGRHNTLDKIAGWVLTKKGISQNCIILTTGRISSEMLQKSIRIGASIVVSRTSPSSLALKMAQESGVCLIGYARNNRFRIYTHDEYISFSG